MPAKTTTTFLILILAQAHFAHTASGPPNSRRPRAAPTVTFRAPTASSTYAPGTSILVSWASDTDVVSPSFRLCVVAGSAAGKRHSYKAKDEKESDNDEDDSSGNDTSDDGGDGSCGAAVWATVKNDGDEYSIEVTAPAVNAPTRFYLEMRDDFDDGMRTDIFTIADGNSATTQDVGGQAPMQARMTHLRPLMQTRLLELPRQMLDIPLQAMLVDPPPIQTLLLLLPMLVQCPLLILAVLPIRARRIQHLIILHILRTPFHLRRRYSPRAPRLPWRPSLFLFRSLEQFC
ncbi:hypothetical protein BDZ89DRAFT_389949 [Hymenopellis radicata]|nr:hypothetical protein BDZ89DRAFT_389949 [Hymenopellis radicata]